MNILIYGPEGSGKSTQAKLLAKKLAIPYLISGDLVRKAATEDKSPIGDVCRQVLDKGRYVPNKEMFVLWQRRLREPDTQKGWTMDGFPRNIEQLRFLERELAQAGKKIDRVFYLVVSEKESIKRLLKRKRRLPSGECHDTPERIKARLREYKKGAAELLAYFYKKGILEEIDGERPIEEILADILKRLS